MTAKDRKGLPTLSDQAMQIREGVYHIRHPLFLLVKPRLTLKYNNKMTKVKGSLRWLNFRQKLKLIKMRDNKLLFIFLVDILTIDLVLNFYRPDAFEGFVDLPIGMIPFTGRLVQPFPN